MNPVNASPMLNNLGTQDLSMTKPVPVTVPVPQFCPKQFIYAQKGISVPQLTVGAAMVNHYGADTFDLRKKYANHSTVFANMFNSNGNAMMVHRVIPTDATKANMMLVVDVLETTDIQYTRNVDGTIKRDLVGNPIALAGAVNIPVVSYQFSWVDTSKLLFSGAKWVFGQGFTGGLVGTPAFPTDPLAYNLPVRNGVTVGVTNKVYPWFEFLATSEGEYGNNCGINIWAPTAVNNTNFPTSLLNKSLAYPINIQMVTRPDSRGSSVITPTIMGGQYVQATLKTDAIDPISQNPVYIGQTLISNYQNLTDARFPNVYADFGNMVVYQNNIDYVHNLVMSKEANPAIVNTNTIIYDFFGNKFANTPSTNLNTSVLFNAAQVDFTEKYILNLIGGVTSGGVQYETWRPVNTINTAPMNQYSVAWGMSGSDGTMNDLLFAKLVEAEMAKYINPNDPIQEDAVNVESVIIDSGFPLATKMKLLNGIAVRRDTAVILGTYQATVDNGFGVPIDGPVLSVDQELSVGIALRTAAQMFPESDYFGVPVMRVAITQFSARVLGSMYTKRIPLSYEFANIFSKMAGSSNGKWNSNFPADNANTGGSNIVKTMYDISVTWVPPVARVVNWSNGLNWVQQFDTRSYFFPAFKTVYSGPNSDTSVLNSFATVLAICQINKITSAAWRNFTNSNSYTPAQLVDKVNKFIIEKTNGIFDNKYVIVPDAQITNTDLVNGYSWTTPVKIYANNMYTVMTTYVQAYRMSSYTA